LKNPNSAVSTTDAIAQPSVVKSAQEDDVFSPECTTYHLHCFIALYKPHSNGSLLLLNTGNSHQESSLSDYQITQIGQPFYDEIFVGHNHTVTTLAGPAALRCFTDFTAFRISLRLINSHGLLP